MERSAGSAISVSWTVLGAAQDVLGGGEKDVAGAGEVFGPHLVHIHPAQADLVFYLVPQVAVRREQVQACQQGPADAVGPHGGLFLKGVMMTVISVNHGACFLSFLFLRPVRPGCGRPLAASELEIWLVLHEALEELVGGFDGEERHGKQLLSGE